MTRRVEAGAAPWSASSRMPREAGTSLARVSRTLTFTRSPRSMPRRLQHGDQIGPGPARLGFEALLQAAVGFRPHLA